MNLEESVATGKLILVDLTRSVSMERLTQDPSQSVLHRLHEVLNDMIGGGAPKLDFATTMRELWRRDEQMARRSIYEIFARATPGDPSPLIARFIRLPFERIYTTSYSGELAECALNAFGVGEVDIVEPELHRSEPSQSTLQVVSLCGDIVKSDEFRPVDYSSLPDGGTRSWFNNMFAEAQTRPVLVVAEEMDAADWRIIELLGNLEGQRFVTTSSTLDEDRFRFLGYAVVASSIAELVNQLPSSNQAVASGKERLARRRLQSGSTGGVRIVNEALFARPSEDGRFLRGYQPTWADVQAGGFIKSGRIDHLLDSGVFVENPSRRVVVLRGGNGSGKSGSLMLLGQELTSRHLTVGWINRDTSKKLKDIRREVKELKLDVLIIDDIDMFGERAASLCQEFTATSDLVLVAGIRTSRFRVLSDLDQSEVVVVNQPRRLTRSAIGELVESLSRYGILGELRRISPTERVEYVESEFEGDLLAVLVKIVTGEELTARVLSEVSELDADQRSVYELICFLSAVVFEQSYTRDSDIYQMTSEQPPYSRVCQSVVELEESGLVRYDRIDSAGVRARHRAIAELVLASMAPKRRADLLFQTSRYFARSYSQERRTGDTRYRHVQRLVSHNVMLDLGLSQQQARAVYKGLQRDMDGDMHFWLQRGTYEAERGDLSLATNYLDQATACDGGKTDFKVRTQSARVSLLRSIQRIDDPELRERARRALEDLFALGREFASESPHTFAVMAGEGVDWFMSQRGAVEVDLAQRLLREVEFGRQCCKGNAQLAQVLTRQKAQFWALAAGAERFPLI